MASDLGITISVGATVGAAVGAFKSLKSSLGDLSAMQNRFSARQQMLGAVLQNPLRMSRERVGELKREYVQLGATIDKLRAKQDLLGEIALGKQSVRDKRQALKGELLGNLAAVGTIAIPVHLAMEFESSMASVKKVVNFDTPQQFKEMGSDILNLTREIPMAGTEIAKIVAAGGQAGIAREDLLGFATDAAKMGVAFDMSADEAGEAMATMANVLGKPIKEMAKVGDAINHLSDNANSSARDIVNVMVRAGSDARHQMGLTENQTAALGSTFLSLGKGPELAAQAMKGMATAFSLAKAGQFDKELKKLGLSGKSFAAAMNKDAQGAISDFLALVKKLPKDQQYPLLMKMFGRQYADDVILLAGSVEEYNHQLSLVQDKDAAGNPKYIGSMQREFENQSATTANQLQLLKGEFVHLGITLGSTLLPVINDLLKNTLRPAAESVTNWAKANPELLKTLVKVGAGLVAMKAGSFAVRALVNEGRGLVLMFRSFKAVLGSEWLMTVLKFRLGGGKLFAALKSLGRIKGFLGGLKTLFPSFAAIGGKAFGLIAASLKSFVLMVPKAFGLLISGLRSVTGIFPVLAKALMTLGRVLLATPVGFALGMMASAAYLLYTRWDDICGGAKLLWQDLGNALGAVADWLLSRWDDTVAGARLLWADLGAFIGGIADALGGFFQAAWANIQGFFNSGIGNISATILNFSPIGLFYQAFAAVFSWFGVDLPAKFSDFGSNILQGLWDGLKAKWEAVKAWWAEVSSSVGNIFAAKNTIHSPSRLFMGFGGFITEGLALGLRQGQGAPLAEMATLADKVKQRFTGGAGELSADLNGELAAGNEHFAAARESSAAQSGSAAVAALSPGYTIHYQPTINAPASEAGKIEQALQLSQAQFEAMFRRMSAETQRRNYLGAF